MKPLLFLALALLASLPAHADFRPSITWLKRVDEVHFRADASTVTTRAGLMRIDTERGVDNHGEQRISYSSSLEEVQVLEAWTQTADGQRLVVAPDKIRTLEATDEGGPEFSDAKVRVVIFPAVTVGAQLYIRYTVTQHTPFFPGHATWSTYFAPGVRFEDSQVLIRQDPGLALQVQARGLQGGRVPAQADDAPGTVRYAFSFRQDKVSPPERRRVALSDFAPFVHATTFANRAELARAYQAHARPKAEPTPEIRQLAAELTAGAATEREKVRRLYNWVSRNIRYVSLAVGAGGYIPNPAAAILEHRYGDCKDHVVLLEALLRSVGIESSPALVNADDAMRLPELAMLTPFDHVITYVPSLDLYLDSTARFAPMGTLVEEVMDKPVLLTATGKEARTPRTRADVEVVHSRTKLQVGRDGEVVGSSVAVMRGAEEVISRSAQFNNQNKRQEDLARQYLSRYGESGTGRISNPDPLDLDKPWEVKATFRLDPVVNVPGQSAMTLPVGIAPGHLRLIATLRPIGPRQFEFICTAYSVKEEAELQLPNTVRIQRIPQDVQFKKGPLRYTARYTRKGNLVRVMRELNVERPGHTCAARDDEDWASMLRVLQRDLRGQVFLR